MARERASFKQSDVARALKGAAAGGVTITRVEIEPGGKIALVTTDAPPPETTTSPAANDDPNPWDDVVS